MNHPESSVRLNKYLALHLGLSRREADTLIESGTVRVNGAHAPLGTHVQPNDQVSVSGKPVATDVALRYVALHKPTGYVSSRRPQGDTPTIYSLLPPEYHHLKPVGRLDKDSSGLILLTNDGDFAHHMTHPSFAKTKVYQVTLDKPLQPLHQQMISDYGIALPDGVSKFLVVRGQNYESRIMNQTEDARQRRENQVIQQKSLTPSAPLGEDMRLLGDKLVQPAGSDLRATKGGDDRSGSEHADTIYEIHMSEGRNRQIRRTFAALGYTVTSLHRTQFGNYSLGDIKEGEYKLTKIS